MKYMLDTNIIIYAINQSSASVLEHLGQVAVRDICLSSLVLAELAYGFQKSANPQRNEAMLSRFIVRMDILPFDALAANCYGQIRAGLERRGTPIGPLDLLIAAHALSRQLTLVTRNVREFSRVRGLAIENWAD